MNEEPELSCEQLSKSFYAGTLARVCHVCSAKYDGTEWSACPQCANKAIAQATNQENEAMRSREDADEQDY